MKRERVKEMREIHVEGERHREVTDNLFWGEGDSQESAARPSFRESTKLKMLEWLEVMARKLS